MLRHGNRIFFVHGRTCRRVPRTRVPVRDYRFKNDSSTPSSSFCLATSRCAARRLFYPLPRSLGSGDLFVSSPYPKHYFKRSVHTPRRAEEQEAEEEEEEDGGWRRRLFRGWKNISHGVCEPAHFGLLPFFPSFSATLSEGGGRGGTFSTDACAFPDFISLGKIIVALARAPSGTAMCARVSTRLRGPYVSAGVYECACVRVYACVCVNDARTMALNWRLTGEQ